MVNRFLFLGLLLSLLALQAEARGRQPANDDADNFPDYNRLEMRPKPKTEETPPPATVEKSVEPVKRPSLNPPLIPPVEDDAPQPPPKVVPIPAGAGEPPMPDEIMNTLGSSTSTPAASQ